MATSINMLVKLGAESLKPNLRWHANCTALVVNHEIASMFKIMPNTVCQFSLAEILLMAAMNQVEASKGLGKNERKTSAGFISRYLEQNKEVNVMASESGFKTVWGFDPDDVEKAKQRVVPTGDFGNFGEKESGDNFPNDQEVGIPFSFEAQVYELRRIFRR